MSAAACWAPQAQLLAKGQSNDLDGLSVHLCCVNMAEAHFTTQLPSPLWICSQETKPPPVNKTAWSWVKKLEVSWLADEKIQGLSQLGWLADFTTPDWMCSDPQLTHQALKDHFVFALFCFSQAPVHTRRWFYSVGRDATQVWLWSGFSSGIAVQQFRYRWLPAQQFRQLSSLRCNT